MPDIKPDAIKAQKKAKFILRSREEEGNLKVDSDRGTRKAEASLVPEQQQQKPRDSKKPNSLLHSATSTSPSRVGGRDVGRTVIGLFR